MGNNSSAVRLCHLTVVLAGDCLMGSEEQTWNSENSGPDIFALEKRRRGLCGLTASPQLPMALCEPHTCPCCLLMCVTSIGAELCIPFQGRCRCFCRCSRATCHTCLGPQDWAWCWTKHHAVVSCTELSAIGLHLHVTAVALS